MHINLFLITYQKDIYLIKKISEIKKILFYCLSMAAQYIYMKYNYLWSLPLITFLNKYFSIKCFSFKNSICNTK